MKLLLSFRGRGIYGLEDIGHKHAGLQGETDVLARVDHFERRP